jgi:hypothetical protein
MRARAAVVIAIMGLGLGPGPAAGGDLLATVRDQRGQPVEDAVVVAVPEAPAAATPGRPLRDVVDQVNKEFVPYVKPIVIGTALSFPNKDDIRHHVYSFSPAKRFEVPLYSGTPAHPVVFDRSGVVTIGCNIHDWMIAHIYVAETPWYGKTGADGTTLLQGLPPGRYTVRAWHPRMSIEERSTARPLTLTAAAGRVAWDLPLRAELRPRRAPVAGQRGYR